MENAFVLPAKSQNLIFHHVQKGDTLTSILKQYHANSSESMAALVKQALADNPNMTDPDQIQIGQLIALRTVIDKMCKPAIESSQVAQVKQLWKLMDIDSQENIKGTSGIYNSLSLGLNGTGVGLFTLKHTLETNMSALNGIPDDYAAYRQRKMSWRDFKKLRDAKLRSYSHRIGPGIQQLIYGDGDLKEAFKVNNGRTMKATKSMVQHINNLKSIGNTAGKGSTVLVGIGLATSCYQIAHTESLTEKNVIAVQAIAGTTVGVLTSIAVNIFLMGTPAGWFVAIGWGLISAGLSIGAAEKAGSVYKSHYVDTDVVNGLGITNFCN